MPTTSDPATDPASARATAQAANLGGTRTRRRRLSAAVAAIAVVVIAVAVMIVASRSTGHHSPAGGGDPGGSRAAVAVSGDPATGDPKVVVAKATGVLPVVYDRVAKGRVEVPVRKVTDQPALSADGKPLVLYIGAEYCPFCASQRWAVVAALARFGTFSGLGLTHSASDDTYPDTQSLSFHGASYTSKYLAFQGVETATNVRQGNRYAPLDKLTEQQSKIMKTLNAPPYSDTTGSIPFLDLANRYILIGGTYDVGLLKGKSAEQIASALGNPNNPITQGVLGTANMFTACLCQLTGGQPGDVCQSPAARAYQ